MLRHHARFAPAKHRRQLPVVLIGSLAATGYFCWHAVVGTHGYLVRTRLAERADALAAEIEPLELTRQRLRRDVDLLGRDPPAPDVVEEQARSVLGLVDAGDLIVLDRR